MPDLDYLCAECGDYVDNLGLCVGVIEHNTGYRRCNLCGGEGHFDVETDDEQPCYRCCGEGITTCLTFRT